ncbi:SDR family NAD(P)-dependent oxidoreductase [Coxiella endosymbiont of Ornithodoros maritimus]|uniref:SDR family NAD(P)-dependent oxidoreductase n=1 Tax=Coxiella endosymbiont of Ornithodoros maritimus TaxID=1656172 RepID=UPI0022652A1C|nr:SDR family NAD(P)-dependent oxidoreductase [Coxiella endosymbiont of Ornithodoros maritimus]
MDVLVNNSEQQYPTKSFEEITQEQLSRTFEVNVFPYFYMIKAARGPTAVKKSTTIINTAYKGSDHLIDYSAT